MGTWSERSAWKWRFWQLYFPYSHWDPVLGRQGRGGNCSGPELQLRQNLYAITSYSSTFCLWLTIFFFFTVFCSLQSVVLLVSAFLSLSPCPFWALPSPSPPLSLLYTYLTYSPPFSSHTSFAYVWSIIGELVTVEFWERWPITTETNPNSFRSWPCSTLLPFWPLLLPEVSMAYFLFFLFSFLPLLLSYSSLPLLLSFSNFFKNRMAQPCSSYHYCWWSHVR